MKLKAMKNTHKNGVLKKKRNGKPKGQTLKNLSYKLDCHDKLQLFSSTFTIIVSRVNEGIICISNP